MANPWSELTATPSRSIFSPWRVSGPNSNFVVSLVTPSSSLSLYVLLFEQTLVRSTQDQDLVSSQSQHNLHHAPWAYCREVIVKVTAEMGVKDKEQKPIPAGIYSSGT